MEEIKGYPKLQWSVFVKNGKDQQYVVRADSEEEFTKLKTFVLAQVGETLIASGAHVATASGKPVEQQELPQEALKCWKCGEAAEKKSGVSKNTGKPYSAIFCSSQNKSHTQWL